MSLITTPAKPVGEKTPIGFDFASKLLVGEVLVSATCSISVWSGIDTAPSSVLSGTPTVSGTKAYQIVTGGIAGCIYKITCTGTTSAPNNPVLMTLLAVVQDPI